MSELRKRLSPVVAGRRRVLCCHSGTLSGRFPPNSLAAVEECVRAGVPRLEVDVRFMADDAMAIFHDGSLEATTTGAGRLADVERSATQTWRYRWDDGDHAICFLEEVVDLLRGSQTMLQVDLKLMRPISASRASLLKDVLRPVADQLIVGSQAHWNLRRLDGLPVAFDPTLHWHYAPERTYPGSPHTAGIHGLWDDSPLAAIPHATAEEYVLTRIEDLRGLVPQATEWMVDIRTILHLASLGVPLGLELERHGCELAAWTLRADTPDRPAALAGVLAAGATTVITDVPLLAADDIGSL